MYGLKSVKSKIHNQTLLIDLWFLVYAFNYISLFGINQNKFVLIFTAE